MDCFREGREGGGRVSVKYLDWSGFQLETAALSLNFGLALLVNTGEFTVRAVHRPVEPGKGLL